MRKNFVATVPITIALIVGQILAQQADPPQPVSPKPVQSKGSLIDSVKRYVQHAGGIIDTSKSTSSMIVSNYAYGRSEKITIVIVNDQRKNMLGFYIYNFGSVKNLTSREEVYKFLLATNDAITIGGFFVDTEEDIGYKYLLSTEQTPNLATFESVYLTMAAVARDRRPDIRKILDASGGKEEAPKQ